MLFFPFSVQQRPSRWSSSRPGCISQSSDSLQDLVATAENTSHYMRYSMYSTGPQSLAPPTTNHTNDNSEHLGAYSLPYISRSLSIDAYSKQHQKQVGNNANNNNNNKSCELEEYAKRYLHY